MPAEQPVLLHEAVDDEASASVSIHGSAGEGGGFIAACIIAFTILVC